MAIKIMKKTQTKNHSIVLNFKLSFYFLHNIKNQKIDLKIDKNSTVVFLSMSKSSFDKNITFTIKKNCILKVYLIDLIKNSNHTFNIILNNESNCKSFLFAKIFASKNGEGSINVVSNVKQNNNNVTTEQEIKGFLLSDSAKINTIPSLVIDTNKINASHSVNIGHLNKDFIFYLESKGFDHMQAVNAIIENEISILKNTYYNSKKQKIDAYQDVKLTINKMLNNEG